ncbi:hypothetical protein DIPPA_28349 [Diplonema papillatum]|nr:hypothetical protein DIPPA_28349 [Diplonema papillatum]
MVQETSSTTSGLHKSMRGPQSSSGGGSQRGSCRESVRSGSKASSVSREGESVRSRPVPSDARSSVTASSYKSITSTEALNKLTQLEELLDKERRARRAAEITLRTIVTQQHRGQGDSRSLDEGASQRQLDSVMNTLKSIIADTHGDEKRSASGGSEAGRQPTAAAARCKHTAKRSGVALDHRGGLYFAVPPGGATSSRRSSRTNNSSSANCLPPLP